MQHPSEGGQQTIAREDQDPRRSGSADSARETATGPTADLLVVMPHLGAGGAQRVVTLLLNYWHRQGVKVSLLTLFPETDAFPLDAGITRCDYIPKEEASSGQTQLGKLYFRMQEKLEEQRESGSKASERIAGAGLTVLEWVRQARAYVLSHFFPLRITLASPRVKWLRQRFEEKRPAVIISFLGGSNIQTLLAARDLGIKVVISERNDPALQRLDPPWQRLRPKIYPQADLVTANSVGALKHMPYVPVHKRRQVANPLLIPPCPQGTERGHNRFVYVGRLIKQKAPEVLLAAFARIAGDLPNWRLDIVGDGDMRAELEASAKAEGLAGRISFHGQQPDVFPYLYAASVFVLPSRFEGMPNAMLEAMGCGLAIIISDASPGPLELIRDGQTGLVVPVDDAQALSAAMRRLGSDHLLRERLQQAALTVTDQMTLPQVAADWEDMIDSLGVTWLGRAGDRHSD
jgi:glycosyltransferase involved in cell wall biosynthesis